MIESNDISATYRTKAEFEMMRLVITIAECVVTVLVAGSVAIAVNPIIGGLVAIIAIGAFSIEGWKYFPNNPPTRWTPSVFGVSVNCLENWGPAWIPFAGNFTIGYTKINAEYMHADLEPEEMIPGDRSVVTIPVHLYFSIDPANPMQCFMLGGIDKAKDRLVELIGKLLRQWITSPDKGPNGTGDVNKTLDLVRQMSDEAANHILEELSRDDITTIPEGVPTAALMGYFRGRPLFPYEKKLIDDFEAKEKDPAVIAAVEEAVKCRIKDVDDLRTGKKSFEIKQLGLVVRMMVIENIEPNKPTMDALKKEFEAEVTRKANLTRAKAMAEQTAALKDSAKDMDPLEAALILNGNVNKTITETKHGLTPETVALLERLGGPFITAVVNRFFGGKDNNNGGNQTGAN